MDAADNTDPPPAPRRVRVAVAGSYGGEGLPGPRLTITPAVLVGLAKRFRPPQPLLEGGRLCLAPDRSSGRVVARCELPDGTGATIRARVES